MPQMEDPRFNASVILIVDHTAQGAMGIVINKPTQQTFDLLCMRMGTKNLNPRMKDMPVYFGGPLHAERGFVMHQPLGTWNSTITINATTGITHSRDCFDALREPSSNIESSNAMMVLGHAGWSAGQLEQEVINNDWITVPAPESIEFIFTLPAEKMHAHVIAMLGISSSQLVHSVGHG